MAEKWGDLTRKLEDTKIQYVMGELSEADWDAYVESITSNKDYQKILEELKEEYKKYN